MSWFYNLKISAKLLTGFILVALIAGALGVVGIVNIREEDARYTDLYEQFGISQGVIGQAAANYQLIRVSMRNIILAEPGEDKSADENKIKECDSKMKENLSSF